MSEATTTAVAVWEADGNMDAEEFENSVNPDETKSLKDFFSCKGYFDTAAFGGEIPTPGGVEQYSLRMLQGEMYRSPNEAVRGEVTTRDPQYKNKSTFNEHGGDFVSLMYEAFEAFLKIKPGSELLVEPRCGAGLLKISSEGGDTYEVTLTPNLDFFFELSSGERRCEEFLNVDDIGWADASNFFSVTHDLMGRENSKDFKRDLI